PRELAVFWIGTPRLDRTGAGYGLVLDPALQKLDRIGSGITQIEQEVPRHLSLDAEAPLRGIRCLHPRIHGIAALALRARGNLGPPRPHERVRHKRIRKEVVEWTHGLGETERPVAGWIAEILRIVGEGIKNSRACPNGCSATQQIS